MSITISALRSSSMRRSVSRRSCRFSSAKGSRLDLGPRFWGAKACRTPASRSRRQVANRDEYRPSRRRSAPIPPVPLAWSAAARICRLYSAVKRRRLACVTTSGSGWAVVLPPVVLRSLSLRSGSLRPPGGNTTGEEEAVTWLCFTLGDSFSPCSLIKRREVSHSYWHGGKVTLNYLLNSSLVNLNDERSNAPGLDLGDEHEGIAFQVTAEKTSAKVN